VPRLTSLGRRAGPIGVALTAWDLWRRLPPKQRRALLRAARKHGPKVVKTARKHGPAIAEQLAAAARRKKP
jgi:TRAP-type C4-dicarboxylate transport system substrate-binding protein